LQCWRGGERSRSLAYVLERIGCPVVVLEGGYREYRRYVRAFLQREQLARVIPRIYIIAGQVLELFTHSVSSPDYIHSVPTSCAFFFFFF
jgi:hypothetical protein